MSVKRGEGRYTWTEVPSGGGGYAWTQVPSRGMTWYTHSPGTPTHGYTTPTPGISAPTGISTTIRLVYLYLTPWYTHPSLVLISSDRHRSGQYASYWNALLVHFMICTVQLCNLFVFISGHHI